MGSASALRGSENYFRELVESIPEVIYLGDPERLLYVSPAFEQVWGRSPEPLLAGRISFVDTIHREDRESARAALEEAAGGRPAEAEYRILRPDGQVRWIRDRIVPVRDRGGASRRFTGAAEDITDRCQSGDAARGAAQAAERPSQAGSAFLSRMSHELRTPLNAVLGFAQLLEMDVEREEDRESVQQILRAGRHLTGLMNQVVDIGRIDSGRIANSLEPVHVRSVLDEAFVILRALASERKIKLPEQLPRLAELYVRADRQRLKQVVLNLLSNAIKYNRRNGSVSITCELMAGERLRIAVRDTGTGISARRFPDLFTPLARLGAEKSTVEGAGLGLVLSKALMESMDGRIGAESTRGKGSSFWFELPLERDQVYGNRCAQRWPAPGWADSPVKPWKILHIEDDLANLHLVRRIFHGTGCEIMPAMGGQSGLALAAERRPHIVLLDLHLPDLPGEEVFLRLRASEQTAHLPVVVLSADAMPHTVERLRATGVKAYLTKPLDVTRLLDVVDRVLQDRRAA